MQTNDDKLKQFVKGLMDDPGRMVTEIHRQVTLLSALVFAISGDNPEALKTNLATLHEAIDEAVAQHGEDFRQFRKQRETLN